MPFFYSKSINKSPVKMIPNPWDWMAFMLVFGIILILTWGAKQLNAPYHLGQPIPISLDYKYLPKYGLLTVLRMLIAMFFSLLFTFTIGTWAAKNRYAERILIPMIDILQSIPVLGFLSITIANFIALFPGSLLGPECAVIFAIFTAQVWNMTLSFYQSLCTVPGELVEAAEMFHLSAWQKFWRIEVPFAMPGLLWNAMLSMSGSWIFLVASEAITVNNQYIALPGIGSYLGVAINQQNIKAVGYAIIAMLVVIFLYDQLIFRPLLKWSEKFKTELTAQEKLARSWLGSLLKRTHLVRYLAQFFGSVADSIININFYRVKQKKAKSDVYSSSEKVFNVIFNCLLAAALVISTLILVNYIITKVSTHELLHVFILGLITALRVLIIIAISTLIWVPIGVWIGLRPAWAEFIQPIAQFLAAFPMNVLFPLVVIAILKYHLNINIWVTPLMLLGSQWYILFNVIAGAGALPKDLKQVAENFGVTGIQWWRKLILPGIFPYYITGAITAIGNAWNTSVIAEVVNWGKVTLTASGLGAYIQQSSNNGDFQRVALGIGVMCVFIITLNRLVWRPLYNLAQHRYRLD